MGKRRGELKKDKSGQYFRQIGRKRGLKGQPKFRLGSDPQKAELAYVKLGLLWEVELARHRALQSAYAADWGDDTAPEPAYWSDEGLAIAEAIRKHHNVVRFGVPDHIEGDAAYATYLDYLQQHYGHLIQIVPADPEAAQRGKEEHKRFAEHRSRQARLNARIASIPIPVGVVGTTLYQALDAYAQRMEQSSDSEGAKVEAANARRLKNSIPDMDLSQFDYSALERIRDYWASRPEARTRRGKPTGRPISLTTVDNHLSTARRFVTWLDRSNDFQWELPRHGLDALRVNLKHLRNEEDIARLRDGVGVFSIDQLTVIYRYATDFERLLVLLGLNIGASHAELLSLRWDEFESDPPTIKRIRRKTSVYAEYALWSETVQALSWWRQLQPADAELMMVTAMGRPYTRQQLANAWVKIKGRIERATNAPCQWWLSLKHLRKTGAHMVRQVADGEIAGIYLAHGQPVETDELVDHYTRRPFNKVAEALQRVRALLEPMFAAAPGAFAKQTMGRGSSKRSAPPDTGSS